MPKSSKKPLVVVAGQVPPPTGGQNVMIRRILDELALCEVWRTVHLPFYFTPSFQSVRKFRLGKIAGLIAVWLRFLGIVARHGRPDVLLYPSGGPQTVPLIRDILLLPLLCALSRKVVVQFHAAGISERLARRRGVLERVLLAVSRRVAGAIVMTDFNRCDPQSLGIANIEVVPHRLPDEKPSARLPDYSGISTRTPATRGEFRILYAGHLYDLKGTPQLVEAFGALSEEYPWAKLVLMGEFLPPYSEEACRRRCREVGIEARVQITGVLHGGEKAAQFRAAHLFVFPSVAPYESFGLVMAEAMMWGLPIVATDWRGNRDVAGEGGVFCPSADPSKLPALRAVLADALAAPSDLAARSRSARDRFESHFRLETDQRDYQKVITKVLEP